MLNFIKFVNPIVLFRLMSLIIEAVETIEVLYSGSMSGTEKKAKAVQFFCSTYDTIDSFSNFNDEMDRFFKEKVAPKAIDIMVEWFNSFGWNIPKKKEG